MTTLALLVLLLLGSVATMPVWAYSRRWKHYPSSLCFGLATLGALLIAAGAL